jgi:hypothetical protein
VLPHAFAAPMAPSKCPSKCKKDTDLSQVSPITHDVMALGGFVIEGISSIPAGARLQRGATKVSWLDVECGGWAELEGVSELYAQSPRVVIAQVTQEARLHLFDDDGCILISAGLWRISPPE